MDALPTLLIKGKLQPPNGDPELKKELDNWIPIEYIIDWFRQRQSLMGLENRVVVIKSETASGKSTVLPAELFKSFVRGKDNVPGIICTQPRVMIAIENVTQIMKHNRKFMKLGETIGWSTKHNKLKPTNIGLLSATIGTLAQQLKVMKDEEICAKYRFILIDETHERDLQTDMALYMLKNLLLRNVSNINCPFVVLMSATFDHLPFLEYFKVPVDTNYIYCKGEAAGFDEMWNWNEGRTVNNHCRAAADVVELIVTQNEADDPAKADILIFMPGAAEFAETRLWLDRLNVALVAKNKPVFSPLEINSEAQQKQNLDYQRTISIPVDKHLVTINGKDYVPARRVIISTNMAETGLTLPNLKYVIDAGFNREVEYHPAMNISGLVTKPAPVSRIKQRKGRAGRSFRGVFYPLYPEHIYNALPTLQFPQILTSDISDIFLGIISEQLRAKKLGGVVSDQPTTHKLQFKISDIDMVDVPTPDAATACIEKYYLLGLVSPTAPDWDPDMKVLLSNPIIKTGPTNRIRDVKVVDYNYSITKLGAVAHLFSMVKIESVRMILSAYYWECSILDVVTIAAYLAVSSNDVALRLEVVRGAVQREKRPTVDWATIYKHGLPKGIFPHGTMYKTRLMIADDFIHGVILYNAICRQIDVSPTMVSGLRKWCISVNLNYDAVVVFLKAREELIDQMLTEGFDVFSHESGSLANSTPETFMDTITRLKYCIYDGYRSNMLQLDGVDYKTTAGVKVSTPALFAETEQSKLLDDLNGIKLNTTPKVVLYHELTLKDNRHKTGMYDVISGRCSTMDGFISVDPDFSC